MKAMMREADTQEFIEIVDVKSGPHRMVPDGDRYRAAPGPHWKCDRCGNVEAKEREVRCWRCGDGEMAYHDEGEGALDIHSVRRADGTPWLVPSDMIQFIE